MSDFRLSALVQLTLWRVREFTREPEALFWVFAFPIVLAFALGLAFKNRGVETVRVAVVERPTTPIIVRALERRSDVEAVVLDASEARRRLSTGRVAMVVVPGLPIELQFDSTRPESQLARLVVEEALQEAAGRRDVLQMREARVTEPGARYIDFLIPGLLGLNIMGTGMWGIGFGVVKARTHKLLKRLLASPMRKRDYLLSHMVARLFFLTLEVASVVLFGYFVFGVPLRGSVVTLGLVATAGGITFAGLGLLVASRARTIEGVSGLMNLVMVPMWIASGVFFAYSHFPDAIQPLLRALPLTALNDALRAVMLDGAPLTALGGWLLVLLLWSAASFGVALRIFRWQ
jgi:ABC-type multidrug transport system permease subunit